MVKLEVRGSAVFIDVSEQHAVTLQEIITYFTQATVEQRCQDWIEAMARDMKNMEKEKVVQALNTADSETLERVKQELGINNAKP